MGWRIRQIVRLGPLLRLNLSRTGASVSVGKPGLTFNLGRGRARTTVSAPGTGISYSTSTSLRSEDDAEQPPEALVEQPAQHHGASGKSLVQTIANWLRRGR